MTVSIDATAAFNPVGDIKPIYVRLEDENHELHTYKIHSIKQIKDEKYSGIASRLFYCTIVISDGVSESIKEIVIRYHFQSHKWSLIDL